MTACQTNNCNQGRKPCPTPLACGLMTQEGGTSVHFEPAVREIRRLEPNFRTDFGIEHTPVLRWYHRVPTVKTFICVGALIGFVLGAVRHFS